MILEKATTTAPLPFLASIFTGVPVEWILPASVGLASLKEVLSYTTDRSRLKLNGLSFLLNRPDGKAPPAPDLLRRRFTASSPGQRLVGDISGIPTSTGWLYLAVLLDLCTREIVGWATAAQHNATLVIRALRVAVRRGHLAKNAVLHSDRGAEYTSSAYRQEIARIGARQSLSRSGSCLDNAPAEAFFATLKTEIGRRFWPTRRAAVHALDQWIKFYNTQRPHSAIGYRVPTEVRIQNGMRTAT